MNMFDLLVMHRETSIDGLQVVNLDEDDSPFTETDDQVIVYWRGHWSVKHGAFFHTESLLEIVRVFILGHLRLK